MRSKSPRTLAVFEEAQNIECAQRSEDFSDLTLQTCHFIGQNVVV